MATIKNPWKDGRDCAVLDTLCQFRPCLHIGENKGTFTPGRGYTSYYKNPKLVCMTRHLHGCPYPLRDADPEKARCCRKPDFAAIRPGVRPPRKQRCRTCGQWADGVVLEIRRALPPLPHVDCRHQRAQETGDTLFVGSWRCPTCGLYWKRKPEPMEPGMTYRDLLDERFGKVED